MNFKPFGNAAISSSSIRPVTATDPNVLYAATTSSKAPDWHSWINSARDRAWGTMTEAMDSMEVDHCSWALFGSTFG